MACPHAAFLHVEDGHCTVCLEKAKASEPGEWLCALSPSTAFYLYISLSVLEWNCECCLDAIQLLNERMQWPTVRSHRIRYLGLGSLHNALTFAANIMRMLRSSTDRGKSLVDSLNIEPDAILNDTAIRNAIQHIDERLDAWVERSEAHNVALFNIGPISGVADSDRFFEYDPIYHEARMLGSRLSISELESAVRNVLQASVKALRTLGRPTIGD